METEYFCEKCNYRTKSNNKYTIHLKSNLHTGIYKCETCNKIYDTQSGLWKHVKNKKCEKPKISHLTELNVFDYLNTNFNTSKDFIEVIKNICLDKDYNENMNEENGIFHQYDKYDYIFHSLYEVISSEMSNNKNMIQSIFFIDERLYIRHNNSWVIETEADLLRQLLEETYNDVKENEKTIFLKGIDLLLEKMFGYIHENDMDYLRKHSFDIEYYMLCKSKFLNRVLNLFKI